MAAPPCPARGRQNIQFGEWAGGWRRSVSGRTFPSFPLNSCNTLVPCPKRHLRGENKTLLPRQARQAPLARCIQVSFSENVLLMTLGHLMLWTCRWTRRHFQPRWTSTGGGGGVADSRRSGRPCQWPALTGSISRKTSARNARQVEL